MPYNSYSFRIFAEQSLENYLADRSSRMIDHIMSRPEDYTLNVNETDYITYLANEFSIENLDIKFNEKFVSDDEYDIPAEDFPRDFNVRQGKRYRKQVIKYHMPFVGDTELLKYAPSEYILWSIGVTVEHSCICFQITNFYDDPKRIQNDAQNIIDKIQKQASSVIQQVAKFNIELNRNAQLAFQARREQLLKKNNMLSALGVPIKKSPNYPETFAVPTPKTRKKIGIKAPTVIEKGYSPEPTLEQAVYEEILQTIQDVGKQFERMPSTYMNKDEEALRDHFLLMLEPRFEGSATGETFNKLGKTDILLRYNGSNVFIAECKFWKGAKGLLETITQLLGYLTWRDSKAAVILFVQNKDFSSVLATTEIETQNHSNFLGFVNKKDETWLNYRFHINDDPNREVKLAVLLFHIPTL